MPKIKKSDLTPAQRKLLEQCGPDAQDHPLEVYGERIRFVPDLVISFLYRKGPVTLNDIAEHAMYLNTREAYLSLRRFLP